MSDEDLKRRASTPSTNPNPTKKTHLELRDIFDGDKLKHEAADEMLGGDFIKGVLESLTERCEPRVGQRRQDSDSKFEPFSSATRYSLI
jgi:hypothetical protein